MKKLGEGIIPGAITRGGKIFMQGRPNEEAIQRIDGYEQMVNTAAQNAKAYWRLWGPIGEPMIRSIDAWAQMQRASLQWLREASEAGRRYSVSSPRHGKSDEEADISNFREAERSAKKSAKEAQRIAREEAERNVAEAEIGPSEDIRSTIRESVRQSEVRAQEETQAATSAPDEIKAGSKELPIEGYNSLNVNQVTQRLRDLSVEELERLRDYEAENRNRRSLIDRFERRIRAAREDLKSGSPEIEETSRESIRSVIRESVRRSTGDAQEAQANG